MANGVLLSSVEVRIIYSESYRWMSAFIKANKKGSHLLFWYNITKLMGSGRSKNQNSALSLSKGDMWLAAN